MESDALSLVIVVYCTALLLQNLFQISSHALSLALSITFP